MISFSYLPRFIYIFDPQFKTLSVNPSVSAWVIWILGLLDGLLVAAANMYVVLTHYLVKPRNDFHLTAAFMFVAGTVGVGVVWVIVLIALPRVKDLAAAINQINSLHYRMTKRKNIHSIISPFLSN